MSALQLSRSGLVVAGLLLLASCSSIPTRKVSIFAINTDEQPVPCLVIVGNEDWGKAEVNNQFVHLTGSSEPLVLEIPFDRPEVKIMVAPLAVDPGTGKPRKTPKTRLESAQQTQLDSDERDVKFTDPARVLFVLRPK